MRICFLTYSVNTTDGGGRFSFDLVSCLKKSGNEISLLTHGDLLKNPFINFLKIRNIFKNSDIIHAVDIWPNGFYARVISLCLKKPLIITALGTYSFAPFYSWRRPFMIWASKCAQIIAISEYTKIKIKEIAPKLNIRVIIPG